MKRKFSFPRKEPRFAPWLFSLSWEQRKIGDFCKIDIGEFVIRTKQRDNAPYPVYNGGSSYTGFYDEFNQDGKKVIVSARGANAGFVNKCETAYWAGNSCYSIGVLDDTDWIFLYHAIKHVQLEFIKGQQSANIPSVSKEQVQKTEVACPSCQEQKKIAVFLEALDTLITLHQRGANSWVCVRFRRFCSTTIFWEQRKLGDLSDKVTEKNSEKRFNETFTNSAESGIISQRDYFDHDISNSDNLDGYYVVAENDFVYNPRISTTAPVGPINRNKLNRKGVMSPLYTVFRTHDVDETYLEYFFKSDHWHDYMYLNGDSGARSDRFSIKDSVFMEMPIAYPCLAEQQQIGRLFDEIIRLITLHQRKLELVKNRVKTAFWRTSLKNHDSCPLRLTFAWEQRKFSELVLIERGGSPRPIDAFITDSPDGLNWIKIGDAPSQGKYITKTEEKIRPEGLSKTRVVQPGDLILSNSMSFGRPYIMGISGCIHDGWLLIRNTKEVFDLTFLCHLLGSGQMLEQYSTLAAGSTVNNLNKELVGSAIVKYPSLEEQRKIGAYLERVDDLITLHQREFTHTNPNTNYVKYYQRNRPLLCVLRSMDKSV